MSDSLFAWMLNLDGIYALSPVSLDNFAPLSIGKEILLSEEEIIQYNLIGFLHGLQKEMDDDSGPNLPFTGKGKNFLN